MSSSPSPAKMVPQPTDPEVPQSDDPDEMAQIITDRFFQRARELTALRIRGIMKNTVSASAIVNSAVRSAADEASYVYGPLSNNQVWTMVYRRVLNRLKNERDRASAQKRIAVALPQKPTAPLTRIETDELLVREWISLLDNMEISEESETRLLVLSLGGLGNFSPETIQDGLTTHFGAPRAHLVPSLSTVQRWISQLKREYDRNLKSRFGELFGDE